jgi:hypothetical protein
MALIKQATFLICDSSRKFQNDLDDQDLMLATVPTFLSLSSCGQGILAVTFMSIENKMDVVYALLSFVIMIDFWN